MCTFVHICAHVRAHVHKCAQMATLMQMCSQCPSQKHQKLLGKSTFGASRKVMQNTLQNLMETDAFWTLSRKATKKDMKNN